MKDSVVSLLPNSPENMWGEENPKGSKAGMVEWVASVLHKFLHSSIHDPINCKVFLDVGLDLQGIGEIQKELGYAFLCLLA